MAKASLLGGRKLATDGSDSEVVNGIPGADEFFSSFDRDTPLDMVISPATVSVVSAASPAPDAISALTSPILSNVTVVEGGSAEIDGPGTQSVTFTGTTGTLTVDHSLAFTGQISGLAGSDALDLSDISYGAKTTATFLGNATGGTLTVTDGSHTANISLAGDYLSSSWTLSRDVNGGTMVVDPVASNAWKELKVGAGGWLTGIDIAPDGTMVVRTDTYGAYIWNGTQWQQLVTTTSLSVSDRGTTSYNEGAYEIKIAPSNTNILYMEYLGNVYRSNDKGTTWTKTAFAQVIESPNDAYRMNGQKMAVDPNNPNVVYVGTPQNGMFVTTDGGATWQNVTAVPVSATDANGVYPGITGITFDPTSGVNGGKTNTIYASSYGHGVYESTDGGISWSALSGGPSDVENAAISSTGVYYAIGNNNKSLWRYANGAWTQLNPAGSNYSFQNPHTVSIDPFNPLHIVVGDEGGALNQSLDGGATWSGMNWNTQLSATDIPWLATAEKYMSSGGMVFDPLVPNRLWASDGIGVWNTNVPQNLLWNTPVVWNSQSTGIEQLVANEIVVAPGGKPVVASWDRPFFYVNSPDQYPSAYGVGDPHPFSAGWSIDYASSNPSFLVGINDWWGVEQSGYSTDGGQTWHMFPTMPSFAGTTIGGTIAASSPTDIVWAPADGVAPQYTKDGGLTWHPVVLPGVTDWSTFDWAYYLDRRTVTADRVLPDTFYMYSFSNGVFKSADGGATWTKVFNGDISPGSGFNARVEAVPGEAGNLFFTGGPQGGSGATHPAGESFFQSTDGGATWTAVPNVLEVITFGFGAPATPGAYPAVYIVGWVNSVYGIWQSNDDAKSWTMIGDYPAGSLDNIKTISGDPNIYGQVYVGFGGSGYAYLPAAPVTPPADQAPVVTALNPTLTHNQSVAASSLFTATDPDGQTITTYALKDVTGNGHFVVNGVVQGTNVEIDLTAAQLAQTTYQSGSGSDQLSIQAFDGTMWSGWQAVTVTAPVDQAPVVTASNPTVIHNHSVAASSLFTAADPDGDPITTYALQDVTGNGYFVVNGVVQATNVEIDLTAAQLAQTTYVAGSASDQVSVRAYDGTLWGAWQSVTVTVPPDQAPVVTALNPTLTHNQSVAASSLFTATDPDGDTITTYALKDVTGNGHFVVNGVAQATNVEIDLTAAQLAQTTYQSGSGSDQLSIQAFDGTLWSGWQADTVTAPVDQAPVVTALSKTVKHNQSIAASSLFTATDPEGDTITTYALKDVTGNGHFVVNGVTQAASVEIDLTAAQLAQTTYQAGSSSDQFSVRAFDGTLWSGWQTATVTVPANGAPVVKVSNKTLTYSPTSATSPLSTASNPTIAASSLWTLIDPSVAASSLFTAADPDGDPITTYALKDLTGNGYFVVNGVAQAANVEIDLTPAQLAQTTYQSGSGSDQLSVSASDGSLWSTWQNFTVTAPVVNVIEALGSTSLTEVGTNFYLFSSSGTGPELKINGAAVAAGQSGGWALIGAEQTATGYEVAWKLAGADAYSVWNTDSNGNYTSSAIGIASGTSAALETIETSFHQDLNGDGTIGPVATVIEASGSTSLVGIGNNFYLNSISSGTGPELKINGAAVVAGQLGGWAPIGAEQTATGYEVAWKLAGADAYSVWNTDSSGNYTSSAIGIASGTSAALETIETSFHQDLNGDGTIGPVATVIEASGSTSLVGIGNNFYLNSISSGTGPELKINGAAVVAASGGWAPIGAEQTATGYEVAWKLAGASSYSVWNTDSNGNYTSNAIGIASGTSAPLETIETSFHQDLNGDGTIGPVTTVISAFGSTSLTKVGNNFYLGGPGIELKINGAAVVASQLGGWAPIGAEQTATGYEVAWKLAGASSYSVWNTDSNGNYTSNAIGLASGTSTALESLETGFHQDLNGDGVIGLPSSGIPAASVTQSAPIIVAAGVTVEVPMPYAGAVTFSGSTGTLKLDNSSSFAGTVAGMNSQDTLDLADINFATLQQPIFSGSTSGGTLTVTDGTHAASIALLGNYMASTFVASSDGHGGTYIVDPSVVSPNNPLAQPLHA